MISYTLSSELINKLKHINKLCTEHYAKLKTFTEEDRSAIHRFARISMIGASTRIENALLTDIEIDWVDTLLTHDGKPTAFQQYKGIIENKLSKDRERSIEEVAGCRAMLLLIYEQGKTWTLLTETIVRGLHTELLRFYSKAGPYLGRYKIQSNSVVERNGITGEQRVVFKTADAGPITETAMSDLMVWYNQAIGTFPWSLAISAEFVFRFLAIHPFQDGNGRLGRALFLLSLLQSMDESLAYLAPFLAIDRHIEKQKSEYYWVLNRCSNGQYESDPTQYKIEYFLEYMLKIIEEALSDIALFHKRNQSVQNLSDSALKVLACFKEHPEIRLNMKILSTTTGLPRRTISHSIATLMKEGFLQKYGQGAGVRYQLVF